MAFGYTKAPNTYTVRWQELVTYEVEVEAYDKDEAMELAQFDYGHENEVNCNYWDGSMNIILEKEGEVEEDPDYGYKLAMEEEQEDVEDDPHYPQPG
jgi:hypothetical protein